MALINLGKTVTNNVTGNYTPGAGLLAPLLTGAYEINRGFGNIFITPPNPLIGTAVMWALTIVWTDPVINGNYLITWDDSYGSGRFIHGLWSGEQNPSELGLMFYTNNGRHTAVNSWVHEF